MRPSFVATTLVTALLIAVFAPAGYASGLQVLTRDEATAITGRQGCPDWGVRDIGLCVQQSCVMAGGGCVKLDMAGAQMESECYEMKRVGAPGCTDLYVTNPPCTKKQYCSGTSPCWDGSKPPEERDTCTGCAGDWHPTTAPWRLGVIVMP